MPHWKRPRATAISPDVLHLYERFFDFRGRPEWTLPRADRLFTSGPWECEQLLALKRQLNALKSRLSDKDIGVWHQHTGATSLSGLVVPHLKRTVQPDLVTQAWCKFYELLSEHQLLPDERLRVPAGRAVRSLHLCEAPGAFVTALNHFSRAHGLPEPDWTATTLNPHHEANSPGRMIADDRLILSTVERWRFGRDNMGDVMEPENLHELSVLPRSDLITADGSVDCQDSPSEQEAVVLALLYCEVICALQCLASPDGTLVLKMFTFFEAGTVCLLFLLRCCFARVRVVKPSCSKSGNSEVYVVCGGFRPDALGSDVKETLLAHYGDSICDNSLLFHKNDIPDDFVEEVIRCSEFFKKEQEAAINQNLFLFSCPALMSEEMWRSERDTRLNRIAELRQETPVVFVRRCRLSRIPRGQQVSAHSDRRLVRGFSADNRTTSGSYDQRNSCRSQRQLLELLASRLVELGAAPLDGDVDDVVWQSERDGLPDFRLVTHRTFGRAQWNSCRSSKFCRQDLLRAFIAVEDAVEKSGAPTAVLLQDANLNEVTTVTWSDTLKSRMVTLSDLQTLVGSLKHLGVGDSLQVVGFSLLHRLNVSLLHILSALCESVLLLKPVFRDPAAGSPSEAVPAPLLWVIRFDRVSSPNEMLRVVEDVIQVLKHPLGDIGTGDVSFSSEATNQARGTSSADPSKLVPSGELTPAAADSNPQSEGVQCSRVVTTLSLLPTTSLCLRPSITQLVQYNDTMLRVAAWHWLYAAGVNVEGYRSAGTQRPG